MSEETAFELPAVMAAAQALAEAGGSDRVGQGDLRDAEKAILAAICPHDGCSFWRGHDGEHSQELNSRLAVGEEARQLLETIVDMGPAAAGPVLDVAREFLEGK